MAVKTLLTLLLALYPLASSGQSVPPTPATGGVASDSEAARNQPEPQQLLREEPESALQRQNKLLVSQNQLLQQELDILTANYDTLAENRSNQFFLYGGLLLFLGACLSALLPRLRGRKRFEEWG